jgi:hypothetical protein
MNDSTVGSKPSDKPSSNPSSKVDLSVQIDAELLEQIRHLTNDPSKVIEVAVRQWLSGSRRDDEVTRTVYRNPPVPPKGEWND